MARSAELQADAANPDNPRLHRAIADPPLWILRHRFASIFLHTERILASLDGIPAELRVFAYVSAAIV